MALQSIVSTAARGLVLAAVFVSLAGAAMADISQFVGSYKGSAEVLSADGTPTPRDMSVEISKTKNGFQVNWTSTSYRSGGRVKSKSYSINFVPSDREKVFAAAMQRNVFGHEVQLDPMAGEPYVWARIDGDTLSLYSIYVSENGGYEIQQYDRTLAEGGLDLKFSSVRNGEIQRTVSTFLTKQ